MRHQRQSGFTLIEIIIAVAIAGLLLPIILAGQKEIRSRAQFSDAVARVQGEMIRIRNEANTTVNTKGTDAGYQSAGSLQNILVGKKIAMDNGSVPGQPELHFTVYSVVIDEGNPYASVGYATGVDDIQYEITFPWGIHLENVGSLHVAFFRNPNSGLLETYPDYYNYDPVDLDIALTDYDGHHATIHLDHQSGNVTKVIE